MSDSTTATTCPTCNGHGRIACPGPTKAKTNAERALEREMVDWCWGMHMGHRCPDCGDGNGRSEP